MFAFDNLPVPNIKTPLPGPIAASWLAFSLFNLATYVGDARAEELPLVGLSDDPLHDWNYLLSHLGLLDADTTLAGLIRLVAFLTWAVALAFGAWLLRQMHLRRGERPSPDLS